MSDDLFERTKRVMRVLEEDRHLSDGAMKSLDQEMSKLMLHRAAGLMRVQRTNAVSKGRSKRS